MRKEGNVETEKLRNEIDQVESAEVDTTWKDECKR